ncbi:MAG: ATP-binding cassette domain-containing protein [Clostridia bacterium]|nr:ATP-binding cassette domain-containing protein [Clostridia bacterium]
MSLFVDIRKNVGNFMLDVKFEAEKETMGILGMSGCGKSMTLKCIAGVEVPDEGKIVLDGRVLFDSENKINLPPQKRHIGYLFQNYALFPNMTVEENIAAGIKGDRKLKEQIVKEKVSAFYLEGLEKKRPAQLSGGQRQRVALARLLASGPKIIMLDEPFSALDSHLKWKLEQEILKMLSEYSGICIMVSHNKDEVYRVCNKVAVLANGKIDIIDDKKTLFKDPKTVNVAILTGCKNISRAEKVTEYSLRAIDWNITLYVDKPIKDNLKFVGIRANHIKYSEKDDGPNIMECNLLHIIESPFSRIIMIKNKKNMVETEFSQIRWETEKSVWEKLQHTNDIRIIFPKGSIFLLE